MNEIRDKVTTVIMAEVCDYTDVATIPKYRKELTEIVRTLVGYAMLKSREVPIAES